MERRLGRGLGSLISASAPAVPSKGDGQEIPLQRIRPNPHQPRRTFDEEALEELRSSLAQHGLLQPIVLREAAGGYEIVSGERRWRAARMEGWETIPAIVREASDEDMLELALVENVQRRDLDPIEKARGYRDMVSQLGLTQEAVARKVGLRRATVANHLRLLELPEAVQDALAQGLLSMGHARALLGLEDEAARIALMEETVRRDLSVREVERRVREHRQGEARPDPRTKPETPPWARAFETKLRDRLGTKVSVENGENYRGRIVIEYFDRDGLERLMGQLAPERTL